MLNEEGGIDPLEFRFYAHVDRVNTTGTVWLGLTVGCAQCHTHKFDPIPQREYYQLMAFLNNADEPTMPVPDPAITARRAPLKRQIDQVEATLRERYEREHLQPRFEAWLHEQSARAVRWTVLRPIKATSNTPQLHVLPDDSVLSSGDQSKRDIYQVRLSTALYGITALRLEVLPDDSLPHRGPGRVYYEGSHGDFFLAELSVRANRRPVKLAHASQSYANGNNTAAHAIDGNDETGWSIAGGEGKGHAAVFNFAQPLIDAHDLRVRMLFERDYASDLGRFRISVTCDSRQPQASPLPTDIEALLLVPAARRTATQRDGLLRYWLSVAPELVGERAIAERIRRHMPAYPSTLVLQERPADETRPTFIHRRGEYLQTTERVQPGVLSILPPLPKGALLNRLSFARWLVDPGNPLVARADRQPSLGRLLWPGHRCDPWRLRLHGRSAHAPEAARLASCSVRERRLVAQEAASVDRPECNVSAIVPRHAGPAGEGSTERAPVSWAASSPGGGTGARRRTDKRRAAVGKDRRPQRISAAAPRRHFGRHLWAAGLEGEPRAPTAIAVACTPS